MPQFASFVEKSLLSGIDSLNKHTQKLQQNLPIAFIGKLAVVKFSEQQAVVATPNQAWASKARYYIQQMRADLLVKSVKIVILPDAFNNQPQKPAAKAPRQLSASAQQTLIQCANCVTHPSLRQALLNLSKNSQ